MSSALFSYQFPANAHYGKKVTKEKIYQFASPTAAVKQKFVQQIERIVWQYKLAPETINIPATKHLAEIQVFDIWLKNANTSIALDEALLKTIDKAISMPLYYRVFSNDQVKFCMAYKRPSEADASQWVVENYFASPWLNIAHAEKIAQPLPLALNMRDLYEQLLRSLINDTARPGEQLAEQLARISQRRNLLKLLDSLTAQLVREKQFNRQIETNRQINALKDQLALLQ